MYVIFTNNIVSLGEIKDWQLAASSVVSRGTDPDCAVKYARLHAYGSRAWCPEHLKQGEWILVDLGVESEVAAVMTQGRDGFEHWVTHFIISYSQDAYRYKQSLMSSPYDFKLITHFCNFQEKNVCL